MTHELKVTCERITVSKTQSNAMFVIESDPVTVGAGTPQRTARTIVQIQFADQVANVYAPGKRYTIAIEYSEENRD